MTVRVDYEQHGLTYARHRREDSRIAARIHAALGEARTVLNVGAGAGSYEPDDRYVLAVEPSLAMRAQRAAGAAPALDASAQSLPFDDGAFEAAMACVTVHHWNPLAVGLAEMRRVSSGPVVVFTFELDCLPAWQLEILREGIALERPRFVTAERIAAMLGGRTRIERIATPADCADGFFEAFWRRPEELLDPDVRSAQSMWALGGPEVEQTMVTRLADALASGEWEARHGHLRAMDSFDGALRLVVSEPL